MNNGLSNEKVIENRKKYGSNKVISEKNNSFIRLFIETLGDPIIKILLVALAIKVFFLFKNFDWFETIGIVVAIFIASFISSLSEYGSEEAFKKLQEESSRINCKVYRNNEKAEIPIDDIVVDDVVILQSGDKIPADGIIIEGKITVDESSLNGETKEVEKDIIINKNVYKGTVVYSGNALIKVKKVGINTLYGKLAEELKEKSPDSPLKIRLKKLAQVISKIGYISAILVSISYLFTKIIIQNNFDTYRIILTLKNIPLIVSYVLYSLTLSVTIIVVAVPEGLPMMITLVLSSNMKKMLKDNVLVRKMVGIETAGSLNILFTDKTGTLTKGELEVVGMITPDLNEYRDIEEIKNKEKYHTLVKESCIYNNESTYDNSGKIIGGNITDRAILKFAKDRSQKRYKKIDEIPFDSKYKYAKVTIDSPTKTTYIKGAPEKLLPLCNKYISEKGDIKRINSNEEIEKIITSKNANGIRTILLCYTQDENELTNLTLIGALYIKDEVRKEAKEGIKLVKEAGIKTVMMTGDNKDTAISIGKEVGLIESDEDIIITSKDLENMSDNEISKILPNLKIVARSLPQDKSRLIRIAEDNGLVVGMTGDGVNDAPALKKANVGIAMGSGTEVCKEASDIVILDNNFLSIAKAILYGRTIFENIRKFIIFQLTINLCAVSLSIIGPFIGIETPVTVIQMLWINMIMDTLAGIAFSYEPAEKTYMQDLPKKKEEPIINRYMYEEILFTGLYCSIFSIIFLTNTHIKTLYRGDPENKYLMTGFFTLFILMSIFNSFNARTKKINIFYNIKNNKVFLSIAIFILIIQIYLIYYGGNLFRTFGLTLKELEITILMALTVIPIDWIRKMIIKNR